jgi:hypothetical protein
VYINVHANYLFRGLDATLWVLARCFGGSFPLKKRFFKSKLRHPSSRAFKMIPSNWVMSTHRYLTG